MTKLCKYLLNTSIFSLLDNKALLLLQFINQNSEIQSKNVLFFIIKYNLMSRSTFFRYIDSLYTFNLINKRNEKKKNSQIHTFYSLTDKGIKLLEFLENL